jgi:hypothetical protein
MNMTQRPGVLGYHNYRYLKISGGLVVLALLAYMLEEPLDGESYGGTWLGYLLGIVSLLIVGVLMWYGIAKRHTPGKRYRRRERRKRENVLAQDTLTSLRRTERRRPRAKASWRYSGTLQEWLSAHVYLGVSLIVLATLHAGFQFGWNIHTLSYALMMLVIASGFFGIYAFRNYPRMMTLNMGEFSLDDLLLKIGELDELARIRALSLPDDVNALVLRARRETRIGGNFWQQISGVQRDCPTAFAAQQVLLLGKKYTQENQPILMRDLYSVLLQKEKLVSRAWQQIALQARLQGWVYFHAPLSVVMLAALAVHILSIFFYW